MGILGSKKAPESEQPAPPPPVQAPAGLSVIAVGMTVRGDLDSNGTVKVEGAVEGDVTTRAQVLVAKGGAVRGDLTAKEAIVGGTVTGAVRAEERVEIQTGAMIEGDITTRRIVVAEGATLNGQVRMGEGALGGRASGGGQASPVHHALPVERMTVPPSQPIP